MVSKEILNSHSVGTLKKEISKTNIKGYSKMKKAEIVELMLKSKEKFMHIEMKEKPKRQMKKKKEEKKEEGTHTMPDGTVMSGETHSEDSKPVKKKKIKLLKKEEPKKEEPKKERKKIKLVSFDKKEEPKKKKIKLVPKDEAKEITIGKRSFFVKGDEVLHKSGNAVSKEVKEKIMKYLSDPEFKKKIDARANKKTEPKINIKSVEDALDKKEEPKKLTERIKEFNKKYNANEIKKQKLDKSNLKKYTDPYFKELEEIEKMLSDIDDNVKFIKDNKELSSTFTDIKKNFVRRVKSNMKKQKANKK